MSDVTSPETGIPEQPQIQPVIEESPIPLDLRSGNYGFHYTTDAAIPTALRHGLLSRYEERKLGLKVRTHESMSYPDSVYFTTELNNLYISRGIKGEDAYKSMYEAQKETVGIAIDRPDFARTKPHGHFAKLDKVTLDEIKALVIIDRLAVEKPAGTKRDTYDEYDFKNPFPDAEIQKHVDALAAMMREAGVAIPIYGVSGQRYSPSIQPATSPSEQIS
jgi:hypothetical protein